MTETRVCAFARCGARFEPETRWQSYCCRACRRAENARRFYLAHRARGWRKDWRTSRWERLEDRREAA